MNSHHITLLLTTSPIPSNPSITMITSVLQAARYRSGLADIPVIILCDGYKQCYEDRRKAGRFTPQSITKYEQFKVNLKTFYQQDKLVTVRELQKRNGFAGNIRLAMEEIASQLVLILQHDHLLLREVPGKSLVQTMLKHKDINYIGFNSYNFNRYDFCGLIHLFPKFVDDLAELLKKQLKDFRREGRQLIVQHFREMYGVPLFPLVFWYDRVHIARRQYYLKQVFQKYKVVNFVEDTFGGKKVAEVKEEGMKAFDTLRSFMYLADDLQTIRHLDGKKKPREKAEEGQEQEEEEDKQRSPPNQEEEDQELLLQGLKILQ